MCPFVDSADLDRLVTEIVGRRLREQLANNVLRSDVPPRSFPLSKLSGTGAAAGDAALFDGSVWAPGGVATQVELDAAVAAWQTTYDALNIGKTFEWPHPASMMPAKHVLCFGQNLSRTTYAAAYAVTCPVIDAVATATASNDRITTGSAHGLVIGDRVFLEAIGAGGAGLAANTEYYVRTVPTTTTITVAATQTVSAITGAVTVAGANLNITSDGTGLVLRACPNGIGSATTFKAPDHREVVAVGKGDMGGSDRGLTGFAWANVLGLQAGEAVHTLLSTESGQPGFSTTSAGRSAFHQHSGTTGTVSSDHAHNVRTPASASGGDRIGFYADFYAGSGKGGVFNDSDGIGANHTHAFNTGNDNIDHTHGVTVSAANAASTHNNVQPSVLVNKIMYVGV